MKKGTEKLTSMNIIYSYIYHHRHCSQKDLVIDLDLSMPTVIKNLQVLESNGFVQKDGFYESDGGRKASIISCCSNVKISIGVELLRNSIHLVAVNLYGETIGEVSLEIPFRNSDDYYLTIKDSIARLIAELQINEDVILGVGIAVQGIPSNDGQKMIYGKLLDNENMNISSFSQYIPYPCIFIHDAKASMLAESWFQKIDTAIYIGLNLNIGSSLLIDNKIRRKHEGECSIEHMCLIPQGRNCYCGRQGCFEQYCSGEQLQEQSGMKINTFFYYLHQNDERCLAIWKDYLHNLSLAINNAHFVLDVPIILGGLISSQLTDDDYREINHYIQDTIHGEPICIMPAYVKNHSAAIGAALQYTRHFLEIYNIFMPI